MPHIILEYSRNLEQKIDFSRLLKKMHDLLGSMSDFELDRSRAARSVTTAASLEMTPTGRLST